MSAANPAREPAVANPPGSRKISFHELKGAPLRQFFLFRPSTLRAGAPIVVSVHGIARNAAAHAQRLTAEAERHGLCVVAPLFEKDRYGQYQQLVDPRSGVRSDLALLDMIDEVAVWTQSNPRRLLLFGYSGGAQFCHRFILAHPHRVASAMLAAAGWYTLPSRELDYPLGLNNAAARGLTLHPEAWAGTPMHVVVGDQDVVRDGSLRRSSTIDRLQGRTRVERGARWVEAVREAAAQQGAAANVTYGLLEGIGHSFVDAIEISNLARLAFERFAVDAALSPLK